VADASLTPQSAPQREIGYAQQYAGGYWWVYEGETTPELQWPQSMQVFDAMRTQDAQVKSVLQAVTLPVRRTQWRIDPNGARREVVELVAQDLGLPIAGHAEPMQALRQRDRFSWAQHLYEALLMLPFGFMPFEQVYRIDEQGLARIRKLGPRLPKTVADVDVASDGGLVSITQYPRSGEPPSSIPVSRLVVYVNDREGGNWIGRSLLRPAYKNWLIKDRLLRVQAQTVERNGMGVPLYKAPPGASDADIATGAAMAQAWRAGQDSGSAIPYDADLVLRGVEGDLPDADKPIRYHDEQIARAVLAHFLNLGTETGSWALGSTFADFFTLSLQTLAQSVADVVTQHIIEDLVDLNWGTAEPAPRLIFDEIGSRQAATATAIKSLIDAGAVTADEVLEGALRQQYGLPPQDKTTSRVAPDGGGSANPDNQPADPTSARPGSVAARARSRRAVLPGQEPIPGLNPEEV
jgi:hypothetical protein